ncbi:MAG: hypothetical protein JST48_04120 [Bacteroidetes bacterium]|nr:hypothetical protein [Bacteroidota bacterium]
MPSPIQTFILLLIWFQVNSQNHINQTPVKISFYYNIDWELTSPEMFFYRRDAYFDLANVRFDGIYNDYDKDGHLVSDGNYYQGDRSGIQTEYNKDLSVKSKIEYEGTNFTIWELSDTNNKYIKNGNGKFSITYYYLKEKDTKKLWKAGSLQGEFANGKRIGKWLYFDNPQRKIPTDAEYYSRGSLLRHVEYTEVDSIETKSQKTIYISLPLLVAESLIFDSKTFTSLNDYFERHISYPETFQRGMGFPHGFKKLLSILTEMVNMPEFYLEILRVKTDEHGQVVEVKIENSVNSTIDELALKSFDVFRKRILPAMKNGKPQKSITYIPISNGARWLNALKEFPDEWFLDINNLMR